MEMCFQFGKGWGDAAHAEGMLASLFRVGVCLRAARGS